MVLTIVIETDIILAEMLETYAGAAEASKSDNSCRYSRQSLSHYKLANNQFKNMLLYVKLHVAFDICHNGLMTARFPQMQA